MKLPHTRVPLQFTKSQHTHTDTYLSPLQSMHASNSLTYLAAMVTVHILHVLTSDLFVCLSHHTASLPPLLHVCLSSRPRHALRGSALCECHTTLCNICHYHERPVLIKVCVCVCKHVCHSLTPAAIFISFMCSLESESAEYLII